MAKKIVPVSGHERDGHDVRPHTREVDVPDGAPPGVDLAAVKAQADRDPFAGDDTATAEVRRFAGAAKAIGDPNGRGYRAEWSSNAFTADGTEEDVAVTGYIEDYHEARKVATAGAVHLESLAGTANANDVYVVASVASDPETGDGWPVEDDGIDLPLYERLTVARARGLDDPDLAFGDYTGK